MNITSSTLPLALRPDYMKEIPATIPYGQNEVWSSEILRGHLDMLDGYVGSGVSHLRYQYFVPILILLTPC
jgi:hypothetical protein